MRHYTPREVIDSAVQFQIDDEKENALVRKYLRRLQSENHKKEVAARKTEVLEEREKELLKERM